MATPAPVDPTWFDWAKLLIPPFGTGLVALVGAYIGFKLANKGRKYEILYKERFKGFEEIAGYLTVIESICDKHITQLSTASNYPDGIPSMYLIQNVEKIRMEFMVAMGQAPNYKFLALQEKHIAAEYQATDYLIQEFCDSIRFKLDQEEAMVEDSEYRESEYSRILGTLVDLMNHCIDTKEAAYKALDLPKR